MRGALWALPYDLDVLVAARDAMKPGSAIFRMFPGNAGAFDLINTPLTRYPCKWFTILAL
jgi:hypothetical protein